MKKISIYQIAAKNLLRKRTRSALTIVGIGLSAWVLASLLGFNRGYDSALKKDIDNMGFQVLLTVKGCPYEAATLMLKGGTGLRYMNESVTADILSQPEVESVTPMLMQAVFDPDRGESGAIDAYLGVDPATFPLMENLAYLRQVDVTAETRTLLVTCLGCLVRFAVHRDVVIPVQPGLEVPVQLGQR